MNVVFSVIWEEIQKSGNLFLQMGFIFLILQMNFLDQMIVNFSESQICKDAEINTFKFFSAVMASIDAGGIFVTYFIPVVLWNEK